MKRISYGVYNCGRIERVEQKDADIIAKYEAFDAFYCGIEDDDEANDIIEAVGAVIWAMTKAEEHKAEKALAKMLAPYGIDTESAIVWYAHDTRF